MGAHEWFPINGLLPNTKMIADAEGQEALLFLMPYTSNLPKPHLPNADAETNAMEQELGRPRLRFKPVRPLLNQQAHCLVVLW
jgi:hypothetical protein